MAKKNITLFKPYESRSPNGNEKGYVRYTNSCHKSEAVSDLKDLAFRVYIDMKMVAKGNGEFIYTQKMGEDRLNLSKGGYTASVRQLIEHGLLERLPRGCYAPSTYKFSANWHSYKSKNRDVFTGEILKSRTKS